jgi:hypothetical protein
MGSRIVKPYLISPGRMLGIDSDVCNFIQNDRARRNLAPIPSDIKILRVEEDGPDGMIVTFSDGTFGAYVVESFWN